jgi:HlyD family secretion protein
VIRRILFVATAAGLLLTGFTFGCVGEDDRAAAPPQTAAVERRDLEVRAEAAGSVEPVLVVEVKSKASGEVLRMHVETGDAVERGALLAEIDPRDVRNALAQAEADLAVASATLTTARAQRGRAEELREAQVVTEQEFEAAALDEAQAQAALVKARTNLELARERSGDVTIRAPIAGTVIEKSVEAGQIIASASANVSGGTTLLRMADLSTMQVRALVDEVDIGRLRPGQPARVTVEAHPGRVFEGSVLKIEPQAVVDQTVTAFPVLIAIDNPEGLLRPGMNAEVEIALASRADVLTVPSGAVVPLREAAAAAATLGLDPEAVRTALGGADRSGGSAGSAVAPRAGRTASGPSGDIAARQRRPASGPGSGEIAPERVGTGPGRRSGATASDGGRGGAAPAEGRPAAVFVSTPSGIEPRLVTLGLDDWDHSEVLRGLREGEQVVLVSTALLRSQQQEIEQRFRDRAPNPFSGPRIVTERVAAPAPAAGGR